MKLFTELHHAENGKKRATLNQNEVERLATESFAVESKPIASHYIDEADVDGHHEYRELPLPAFGG